MIDPLINLNGTPTDETFTNQATATADGLSQPVLSDVNGDPSDGNQPTSFVAIGPGGIGEAASSTSRSASTWSSIPHADGVVNPGDTLEYVIAIRNAGSATSIDTRLTDPIPANTTIVPGSAVTSQGVVLSESPLNVNIGAIIPGSTVTVRFQVTVDPGTPDGTILVNQATATASNASPVPSDDNGVPEDGLNPNLTPVGTGEAAGQPSDLRKDIVATSEPDTMGASVLIGESVAFTLTFKVPPGTTREVTIVDTLPAGLIYLCRRPSCRARSTPGWWRRRTRPASTPPPAATPVQLTDGVDIVVNGQELRVFLGDVINSDNDTNDETYTLHPPGAGRQRRRQPGRRRAHQQRDRHVLQYDRISSSSWRPPRARSASSSRTSRWRRRSSPSPC